MIQFRRRRQSSQFRLLRATLSIQAFAAEPQIQVLLRSKFRVDQEWPQYRYHPTRFIQAGNERYAYRRFGSGSNLPLLCLQHFTGTLDNWDPAVTDPLAMDREVILFENAGLGRSGGSVPTIIAGMSMHAQAFLDALQLKTCDVLGFSLGGMVAQQWRSSDFELPKNNFRWDSAQGR